MNKITISIIIPVHNAEAFIERTLVSCLQQGFPDFEIVAIDDGSKDKSLSILKHYAEKDARVRVFTGANAGVVVARETAVNNSRGEFLLFMDADDTIAEGCLQKMVDAIGNDTDMVIGDINQVEVDGSSNIIKYGNAGTSTGKEHFEWIARHRVGFLWGKLIRRSLIDSIRVMPYGVKFCEDYLQMLQLSYAARKVVHIESVTYNYIQQDESACNKAIPADEYAQRFADLCSKLIELINVETYDNPSKVELKVLFLYYCRLYLSVSGKWGNNKVLCEPFFTYLKDTAVKTHYKATDPQRYRTTILTAYAYSIIAFLYRKQLRKFGRIK